MNYLLTQGMPNERKAWIIPILGLLAKAVPILGGVATGLAAYQSIKEGPGGARLVPASRQITGGTGGSALARLPSERERGMAWLGSRTDPMQYEAGQFRRRRMNVLNPRALSRSIRRVKGFAKFAKRVGSYTDPGKSYKLKGFARRKKR